MNQNEAAEISSVESGSVQLAFAFVDGQAVTELPRDLYIPPDALEVILEDFEGPLDLLLYLIRKQNLDILHVDVSAVTDQYMGYINTMQSLRFELAAEYLLMAAMLAEIKSRMLLPRREFSDEDDDDSDPRMELIRRLQAYEQYKTAAEELEALPRLERDFFCATAFVPEVCQAKSHPDVALSNIFLALKQVFNRADMFDHHYVEKEKLSIRERMIQVLDQLKSDKFIIFTELFSPEEGRLGVVVTFMAVMELIKEQWVDFVQAEPFSSIHIKAK